MVAIFAPLCTLYRPCPKLWMQPRARSLPATRMVTLVGPELTTVPSRYRIETYWSEQYAWRTLLWPPWYSLQHQRNGIGLTRAERNSMYLGSVHLIRVWKSHCQYQTVSELSQCLPGSNCTRAKWCVLFASFNRAKIKWNQKLTNFLAENKLIWGKTHMQKYYQETGGCKNKPFHLEIHTKTSSLC